MSRYIVTTAGRAPVPVQAPNWMAAMALGIAELADAETIDRLVCETLPNGQVIARDARRGTAYIIRREGVAAPGGPDPAPGEVLAMGEEDEGDGEAIRDRLAAAGGVIAAWERALELAAERVPCEAGSALQRSDRGGLRFVAVLGPDAGKLLGVELSEHEGIAGFCSRRGVGLLVRDAAEDARHYRVLDQHTGFRTREVLCAPVRAGGVSYGCIELLNAEGGRGFSGEQLAAVAAVAEALAEHLAGL